MLIEQIHFPQSGPNWGKIALISLVVIGLGVVVYQITKPVKLKIKPKTDPGDKTE
jgi:hypothetical protein